MKLTSELKKSKTAPLLVPWKQKSDTPYVSDPEDSSLKKVASHNSISCVGDIESSEVESIISHFPADKEISMPSIFAKIITHNDILLPSLSPTINDVEKRALPRKSLKRSHTKLRMILDSPPPIYRSSMTSSKMSNLLLKEIEKLSLEEEIIIGVSLLNSCKSFFPRKKLRKIFVTPERIFAKEISDERNSACHALEHLYIPQL